jgi:tRNA (adenine22-N1)-methyltransferase
MTNIKIRVENSPRLFALVEEITKPNSVIVDVGCDHGYIGCYCLLTKKASFIYNVDLRTSPLSVATANLQKLELINQSKNIVADGLKTEAIESNIDYCVIAGMGGHNIVKILNNRNKNIKISDFVLMPNTHFEVVRK